MQFKRSAVSCVVVAILALVAYGGWRIWDGRDSADTTRSDEKHDPFTHAGRLHGIAKAMFDALEGRDAEPWFAGHPVKDHLVTLRIRLAAMQSSTDNAITQLTERPDDEELPKLISGQLETMEAELRVVEKRVLGFFKEFEKSGKTITDAFNAVSACSTAIKVLLEAGVRCPDEQGQLREIANEYERGRRFWLDELLDFMNGAEPDTDMATAGVRAMTKAARDAEPLRQRLHEARVDVQQLHNQMSGIRRTLAWVERILPQIPKSDPFLAKPEGRLATWRERWAPLEKQAKALMERALDRGREHRGEVADCKQALAALQKGINDVFLPKAREHGLALPS